MTADLHRPWSAVELALAETLTDTVLHPGEADLLDEWADDADLFEDHPFEDDLLDEGLLDEDDGPPSEALLAALAAVDRLGARWRGERLRPEADELEERSAAQRARFRAALGLDGR